MLGAAPGWWREVYSGWAVSAGSSGQRRQGARGSVGGLGAGVVGGVLGARRSAGVEGLGAQSSSRPGAQGGFGTRRLRPAFRPRWAAPVAGDRAGGGPDVALVWNESYSLFGPVHSGWVIGTNQCEPFCGISYAIWKLVGGYTSKRSARSRQPLEEASISQLPGRCAFLGTAPLKPLHGAGLKNVVCFGSRSYRPKLLERLIGAETNGPWLPCVQLVEVIYRCIHFFRHFKGVLTIFIVFSLPFKSVHRQFLSVYIIQETKWQSLTTFKCFGEK